MKTERVNFKVDGDLRSALRDAAYRLRVSEAQIIRDALTSYLKNKNLVAKPSKR